MRCLIIRNCLKYLIAFLNTTACFILCPLRISYLDVPYSVSVVSKLRSPPGNILMLRNTDSVSLYIYNFVRFFLLTENLLDFRIPILPTVVLLMYQIKLLCASNHYTLIMIR